MKINMQTVKISDLDLSPIYQREEQGKWLGRREFDQSKYQSITVARSGNGKLVVVDGKQRTLLAIKAGLTVLPAVVVDMDLRDQAKHFVELNTTGRTKVSGIYSYLAALHYDPTIIQINQMVESSGYKVCNEDGNYKIRAVGALYAITKDCGGIDTLRTVLEIIREVYDGSTQALQGVFLHGLGRFVFSSKADKKEIVRKFRQFDIYKIRLWAKEAVIETPTMQRPTAYHAAFNRAFKYKRRLAG